MHAWEWEVGVENKVVAQCDVPLVSYQWYALWRSIVPLEWIVTWYRTTGTYCGVVYYTTGMACAKVCVAWC